MRSQSSWRCVLVLVLAAILADDAVCWSPAGATHDALEFMEWGNGVYESQVQHYLQRSMHLFMVSAALAEYCDDNYAATLTPPVSCTQLLVDSSLRVAMLLEPMTGTKDPVCCALTHANHWVFLRYGSRSQPIEDLYKQKECTPDILCTGPLRFKSPMAELRRAVFLVMTRASPADIMRMGIVKADAAAFGKRDGCSEDGKRCYKHDLHLRRTANHIEPALWQRELESVPHIEMFHNLVPHPLMGNGTLFGCVFRRHERFASENAQVHLGLLQLTGGALKPVPVQEEQHLVSLSKGEDPRMLRLGDKLYVYVQTLMALDDQGKFELINSILEPISGARTILEPPERTASQVAPYGKNWVPFSWGGQLHFIYTFSPLRIMKCDGVPALMPKHVKCTWVRTAASHESEPHGLSIGVFRGGSAGLTVLNGAGEEQLVVGVGHITFTGYTHAPFVWRLDLNTLVMSYSTRDPRLPVSPAPEFPVFDPTSMFVLNQSFFCAATLRRHPDDTTFEQPHMQTHVYQLQSEVLPQLSAKQWTVLGSEHQCGLHKQ
eukprot:TRINITY_DN18111_c0_g2_i1.p1 TRINITY_DN18111_c0_g2~~TRINITY_DN18111_c0_g2_i1.p1  ORF type:complete len:547 (-),score=146.07 TRINITY_DN18111_c0_g2_i1:266-1906(-)